MYIFDVYLFALCKRLHTSHTVSHTSLHFSSFTRILYSMALVTVRASQGGFGVLRKLGPRGLSGPAGGEENFEIAAAFVHSETLRERALCIV